MMLRCRLPGGVITPQQWLGIDAFAAEETFYGSIRLTTRQTFQFHGVLKPKLKGMHQLLHRLGLDSIAKRHYFDNSQLYFFAAYHGISCNRF